MGKTRCGKKVAGVRDMGVIVRHGVPGDPYYFLDGLAIREPMIFQDGDRYLLYYDAFGPELMSNALMLAESRDLAHWKKLGPVQAPGHLEHPSADHREYADYSMSCSPWIIESEGKFFMYNSSASGPKGVFAPLPYYTTLSRGESLAGPWRKETDVPGKGKSVCIPLVPGSWHSDTACAGTVIENPDWKGEKGRRYMMLFSAASYRGLDPADSMSLARGIGIARTDDLGACDDYDKTEGNFWTVDEEIAIPLEDDVENATLFYEEETGKWYMFVNHIHESNTYTDAVWVYWTDNPNHWAPENKAQVFAEEDCIWAKGAIGMPTVVRVGDTLAMVYDGASGDSTSHFGRDIAIAHIPLPIRLADMEENGL